MNKTNIAEITAAAANDALLSAPPIRRCQVCGCTDLNCSGCVERTGESCHWVEADLCSACADEAVAP